MTTPAGTSLALPFRFNGRDLASASGPDLRRAQARHLLLTEPGELAWRTEFGAGLGRLRHHRLDAVLIELARIDVRNAFRRWLPGISVGEFGAASEGDELSLRVALVDAGTGSTVEVTA